MANRLLAVGGGMDFKEADYIKMVASKEAEIKRLKKEKELFRGNDPKAEEL
jgi:hypothetical protein